MLDKMSHIRKNMWLTVVIVSIIGDVGTTWFGIATPGIVESNPLWESYFVNANYAALLIGKSLIVASAFVVDYFVVSVFNNWGFPILPVFFIYSGTYATVNNLQVLSVSGANEIAILIVLSAIAIGVVEFIHSRFNYPLF